MPHIYQTFEGDIVIDSRREIHDLEIHDGDFHIDDLANRNQPNLPISSSAHNLRPVIRPLQCSHVIESAASKLSDTSSLHHIAGYFFAYDAKTGRLLWKVNTGAGVFGSPSVYTIKGEEFIAVASGGGDRGRRGGDLILSFELPK